MKINPKNILIAVMGHPEQLLIQKSRDTTKELMYIQMLSLH